LLQEAELKKVFDKVDRSGRGYLNQSDFEVLLMALGYFANEKDAAKCFQDIVTNEDRLSFDAFFDWWTSDYGASYVTRK
jgi:Ca2+-binding EF-hand superfamily protein